MLKRKWTSCLFIIIMTISAFPWSQFFTRTSEVRTQTLLNVLNQDDNWKVYSLSRFPFLNMKHHFWLRKDPTKDGYVNINTTEGSCTIWVNDSNSIVVGFKSIDQETNLDLYQAWTFIYNNDIWEYKKVLSMTAQCFNVIKAFENDVEMK